MAASAPITVSSLDNAITKFYLPRMWEQIKVEAPGYAFFTEQGDKISWGPGTTGEFVTRRKAKRGILGGTTGRLPSGGVAQYDRATVAYTVFRQLINFVWDAKLASSNERYAKNLVEMAVQDVKSEFLRRMNIYLYTGAGYNNAPGSGSANIQRPVAYTTGTAASGATTVTVKAPYSNTAGAQHGSGAHYLQTGDFVLIVSSVGARAEYAQISSIARPTNTFATGSATLTLSQGLVNPDTTPAQSAVYLASPSAVSAASFDPWTGVGHAGSPEAAAEDSDFAAGLLGIADVVGQYEWTQAAVPGHYLNIARAENSGSEYWGTVVEGNSGSTKALATEDIDSLVLRMNESKFIRPNALLMNSGMWHEYLQGVSEAAQIGTGPSHAFRNADTLPGGHKPSTSKTFFTAGATSAQGDMEILVDPYCPHHIVYACDKNELGYATVQGLSEATDDGGFLRMGSPGQSVSYDEWFGFLRWAGQFVASAPSVVGVLGDVTQDIVAI